MSAASSYSPDKASTGTAHPEEEAAQRPQGCQTRTQHTECPFASRGAYMIRKVFMAAAASSLVVVPVAAQANVEHSVAPVEGESELGGSSIILAILAAAAFAAALYIALDDDEETISV